MTLLEKLRREDVPHAVIFSKENINEEFYTSKALLIPRYFKGWNSEGFLYLTQVHDKTAERDIEYIEPEDIQKQGEYRIKMKSEFGTLYQWDKHDFKNACDHVSVLSTGLGVRSDLKLYEELAKTGKIPSFEINGRYYVNEKAVLRGDYLDQLAEIKRAIKGFDLFSEL